VALDYYLRAVEKKSEKKELLVKKKIVRKTGQLRTIEKKVGVAIKKKKSFACYCVSRLIYLFC
jgi:hypothetical protein